MDQADDVERWGQQWLRSWLDEPGLSDDERKSREWQAAHWERWSLEDWAQCACRDRRLFGRDHSEYVADHWAREHLALYDQERHGLLVWRMFREYRAQGVPVPEYILRKFDQWAVRLESASGVREVALALEMTGRGGGPRNRVGGPQGAALIDALAEQRRLVERVESYIRRKVLPGAAIRRVAAETGMPASAVKAKRQRWWQARKGRRSSNVDSSLTELRMLGRKKREP